MLMVIPSRAHSSASRIVASSVRGSGGYSMNSVLPSKCAVGSPSVISTTCRFGVSWFVR